MGNRSSYGMKIIPKRKDRMTKEQRAKDNHARWIKAHPTCPNKKHMGEFACLNRAQCWEPCGELGKSEEHMKTVGKDECDAIKESIQVQP